MPLSQAQHRRSELSSLKEHLNEKIFNSQLKTDMQQKHMRDSL